jgi:hypothetical protein
MSKERVWQIVRQFPESGLKQVEASRAPALVQSGVDNPQS